LCIVNDANMGLSCMNAPAKAESRNRYHEMLKARD
jgi:hypothetical protein